MTNNPNPLAYHYDSIIKLDYFLLGADIAILGWTITNLSWLPDCTYYVIGISIFWSLMVLSLFLGILKQRADAQAFGANFLMNEAGSKADLIEKETLNPASFIDSKTGKVIDAKTFREYAPHWRKAEKDLNQQYDQISRQATLFGNWSLYLLVMALTLLAALKMFSLL